AVCSACSSCVTGSPLYWLAPRRAKRASMSAMLSMAWARSALELVGGQGRELRMADARLRERARRFEDRVGDRADVRVDALEVADQVDVQRAGLDALRRVLLQPRDV